MYVVITDDELERIKTERDRAIRILHFAPPETIPSVYFDKSYLCVPDGSDKAYELLRRAMLDEGVIGIGQCVLWSRQTMLALIPESDGIRMQTLFYRDQIKRLPIEPRVGAVSETEMQMSRMLVHNMIASYQPEQYRDEYEEKLLAAIQRKIDVQEIVAAAEPQGNIVNLMEALEKILAQQREPELSGVR